MVEICQSNIQFHHHRLHYLILVKVTIKKAQVVPGSARTGGSIEPEIAQVACGKAKQRHYILVSSGDDSKMKLSRHQCHLVARFPQDALCEL